MEQKDAILKIKNHYDVEVELNFRGIYITKDGITKFCILKQKPAIRDYVSLRFKKEDFDTIIFYSEDTDEIWIVPVDDVWTFSTLSLSNKEHYKLKTTNTEDLKKQTLLSIEKLVNNKTDMEG